MNPRPHKKFRTHISLLAAIMLVVGLAGGCAQAPPSLENAGPSVLLVGVRPDPEQPAGLFAVDLYIRDLERDPVDLIVWVWRASGAREGGLVLSTPGHGTRGLNAEPESPGAWHRLYLDLASIPENEELFVEVESVDAKGNPGSPTATDPFKKDTGWVHN
jgi:hypothetical protein